MASSWYNTVVLQMNDMFTPGAKITDTGTKFRKKHGHDGKGNDSRTKAYRFGEFAVDVTDASGKKAVPAGQEPKWLIDSGNRHFDQQSIDQLEAAIIDSLTRPGNELPIVFNMGATLPAGQKATAQVLQTLDPQTKALIGYIVNISCAP
jgi:hypothetical protein